MRRDAAAVASGGGVMNAMTIRARMVAVAAAGALCLLWSLAGRPGGVFAQSDIGTGVEAAELKPSRDIFKSLVEPPKRKIRRPVRPRTTTLRARVPTIPRLQLKLVGIAGEGDNYAAIVEYKGKTFIVEENQESPDKAFKVKRITDDYIEVYYTADKKLHKFPLSFAR